MMKVYIVQILDTFSYSIYYILNLRYTKYLAHFRSVTNLISQNPPYFFVQQIKFMMIRTIRLLYLVLRLKQFGNKR